MSNDPREFDVPDPELSNVPAGEFDVFGLDEKPYKVTANFHDTFLALAGEALGVDEPVFYEEGYKQTTQKDLESKISQENLTKINTNTQEQVQRAIEVADLSSIQMHVQDGDLKAQELSDTRAPEVFDITETPLAKSMESRTARRMYELSKMFSERYEGDLGEDKDPGFWTWGSIGDMLDLMFSDGINSYTGKPWRDSQEAMELADLIATSDDESVWRLAATKYLDRVQDSGLFTDVNRYYLADAEEVAKERGQGPVTRKNKEFATLDVILGVTGVAGTVKSGLNVLRKARSTTAAVRVFHGMNAANRNLTRAATSPRLGGSAGIPQHTSPAATRYMYDGYDHLDAAGMQISRQGSIYTKFWELFNSLRRLEFVSEEAIQKNWAKLESEMQEHVDRINGSTKMVDFDVVRDPDSGNVSSIATIGANGGKSYGNWAVAKGVANKIGNGAYVVEDTLEKGKFWIKLPRRVDTARFTEGLNLSEEMSIATRLIPGNWLTGIDHVTQSVDEAAKVAEAALAPVITRFNKEINNLAKAAGKEGTGMVNSIITRMRDGNLNHIPYNLDENQFRVEFNTQFGRMPTDAEVGLYQNIIAAEDVTYILKADAILKDYVNEGFKDFIMVNDEFGQPVRVRAFDNVEVDAQVLDVDSGNVLSKKSTGLNELTKDHLVYELERPITTAKGETVRFVSTGEGKKVRPLQQTDVLGYNPGGPRSYGFSFSVKQDLDDDVVTILGAHSEADARKAVDELNAIQETIVAENPRLANKNLSDIEIQNELASLSGNARVEEAIARNSGWNPAISTVDDLVQWMREGRTLKFGRKIGFAGWDDPVQLENAFSVGRTHGDAVFRAFNRPKNQARRPLPIRGYGGDALELTDPLETITNDVNRTLHSKAFQRYDEEGARGWLQGFRDVIPNYAEKIEAKSKINLYRAIDESLEELKRLNNPTKKQRRAIASGERIRMIRDQKSWIQQRWESMATIMAEKLWDKGHKGLAKRMFKIRRDARTNPVDWLRSLNFDMRLGFFDWTQLIVQPSHLLSIMAIAPKDGWRASGAGPAFAIWKAAPNIATRNEVARRAHQLLGFANPEEAHDFFRWMDESGRVEVGMESAEFGGYGQYLEGGRGSGIISKIRQKGRIAFNAGEAWARTGGIYVAWKEFKRLHPTADPFSDMGLRWITNRQDVLTGRMTRASSGKLQRNALTQLPFQFMTYPIRMVEQLLQKDLTGAEKARLVGAQIAFWGAAGVGANQWLDKTALGGQGYFGTGINPPQMTSDEYLVMRNGILGWMIGRLAEQDGRFTLTTRLAIGDGIKQTIETLFDPRSPWYETLTGAAGQLAGDSIFSSIEIISNIYNGNIPLTKNRTLELLRNMSSLNRGYRAFYAFNYGKYLSKRGNVVTDGITPQDAFVMMGMMGATDQGDEFRWSASELLNEMAESRKTINKELAELKLALVEAYNEKDWDTYDKIVYELMPEKMAIAKEAGAVDFKVAREYPQPEVDRVVDRLIDLAQKQPYNDVQYDIDFGEK